MQGRALSEPPPLIEAGQRSGTSSIPLLIALLEIAPSCARAGMSGSVKDQRIQPTLLFGITKSIAMYPFQQMKGGGLFPVVVGFRKTWAALCHDCQHRLRRTASNSNDRLAPQSKSLPLRVGFVSVTKSAPREAEQLVARFTAGDGSDSGFGAGELRRLLSSVQG